MDETPEGFTLIFPEWFPAESRDSLELETVRQLLGIAVRKELKHPMSLGDQCLIQTLEELKKFEFVSKISKALGAAAVEIREKLFEDVTLEWKKGEQDAKTTSS